MPIGKTARIQQADRQFGKHLNQIKRICENELSRETKCIEEVFKLEMVGLYFQPSLFFLAAMLLSMKFYYCIVQHLKFNDPIELDHNLML